MWRAVNRPSNTWRGMIIHSWASTIGSLRLSTRTPSLATVQILLNVLDVGGLLGRSCALNKVCVRASEVSTLSLYCQQGRTACERQARTACYYVLHRRGADYGFLRTTNEEADLTSLIFTRGNIKTSKVRR